MGWSQAKIEAASLSYTHIYTHRHKPSDLKSGTSEIDNETEQNLRTKLCMKGWAGGIKSKRHLGDGDGDGDGGRGAFGQIRSGTGPKKGKEERVR